MDYKEVLKSVWKQNKVGIVIAGYNLFVLAVNSFLRPGRILKPIKKYGLGSRLQADRNVLIQTYSGSVADASNAYRVSCLEEAIALYPHYAQVRVVEVDGVVVIIGIEDDIVRVAIRGSETVENWVDNVDMDMQWSRKLKTNVHDGYYEIAHGILDEIDLYIMDYKRLLKTNGVRMSITGHSMGGGLAVLVACLADEAHCFVELTEVISIGGPKVIQADYGRLPVVHIIHVQDPVPYLPVWSVLSPYRHQGLRLVIKPCGAIDLFEDSFKADLYSSLWTISHPLDIKAHSSYEQFFSEHNRV